MVHQQTYLWLPETEAVGKTHIMVSGKTGLNFSSTDSTVTLCIFLNLSELWGFCHSSVGKVSACNVGDPGLISGSGRSTGEGIGYPLQYSWASLLAQLVKNSPTMQETWVRSLGWEDPLERERLPTPVFWPGEFHGLYSP